MANPSPSAVAAIRAQVSDWAASDAAVAAALNAPALPNPAPRGTVPRAFTLRDLAAACSESARPALAAFLTPAVPLVIAQDRTHLAAGLDALETLGTLSQADRARMAEALDARDPDPAYQPLISWAWANLGRPADAADVAAARPTP